MKTRDFIRKWLKARDLLRGFHGKYPLISHLREEEINLIWEAYKDFKRNRNERFLDLKGFKRELKGWYRE